MALDVSNVLKTMGFRELFRQLYELKANVIPRHLTAIAGSSRAESIIDAYYDLKRYLSILETHSGKVSGVEIDSIYEKEYALTAEAAKDVIICLDTMRAAISSIEAGQSKLFAGVSLGVNSVSFGSVDADFKQAVTDQINTILGTFA